jgi:hypothetical protein
MPATGDLLEPKEVDFTLPDGSKKTYILSKFDAILGREIICQYPRTGIPAIGDYKQNEEIMFKLMSHVAIPAGNPIRLSTPELIRNHVKSAETLLELEMAMMEYNYRFFLRENLSAFFAALAKKVLDTATSILTRSSEPSSPTTKQPSTN